jgi:hypothetical protein
LEFRVYAVAGPPKTKLEDYDALLETMELLSNSIAMKTLRAAKAGKLAYKELNLADENFGL